MQYSYTVIAAAAFAGFSAATTPLTTSCEVAIGDPQGNPISAPLNDIVPAGAPFTITWTPTTTDTVTILLLQGPSTNVVPIDTLATSILNSGSFLWTPSTALEPTADATGYGLQIVDDVTCSYQYSTQFGISNSASSGTTTVTSTVTGSAAPLTTVTAIATTTTLTTPVSNATVTTLSTTVTPITVTPTTTLVISTLAPANGTTVYPTGTAPIGTGTVGAVPTSTIVPFTGGAGRMAAGAGSILGAIAAMAIFAL